jgi:hypothetical protein
MRVYDVFPISDILGNVGLLEYNTYTVFMYGEPKEMVIAILKPYWKMNRREKLLFLKEKVKLNARKNDGH